MKMPPPTSETMMGPPPRVLVVDDSAPLRAAIAETLEEGGCQIVGRAMDGSMALRMVMDEDPDVITLDLEMPRMDGFTFLRILQKTKDTPVIIITSDARPEVALMALELGARDFVVKPQRPTEIKNLKSQLLARVRALAAQRVRVPTTWPPSPDVAVPPNVELVTIGASTGGPRALRDLLARLRPPLRAPILIVQHMPPRFTEAFAERLKRVSGLDVQEVKDGEVLRPNQVRVAVGGRNVVVEPRGEEVLGLRPRTSLMIPAPPGQEFCARLVEPQGAERWVPSVDLLFESAARVVGKGLLAIVLTGMGRDGADGARHVRAVGAPLWAESALTAVVEGMPQSAAAAYGDAPRLPLDDLAQLLARTLAS